MEEEQFSQAFGYSTDVTVDCRYDIYCVKNNNANVNELALRSPDTEKFTDLSWRLLGRYIANNTHLKKVDLMRCGITDEKMASIFFELTHSASTKTLILTQNSFGIQGVQSMIPFLNDTKLSELHFTVNPNFNTECFEMLIHNLHDKPLTDLEFGSCNISNVSALETYNLPHIQKLSLNDNNIGREGFIIISNLLQQEGSNLKHLYLSGTGMGDEDAELLATSLENNTKLHSLYLYDNSITKRGYKAFLQLLVDVSSIENTYNSNHTLNSLNLTAPVQGVDSTWTHVESSILINKLYTHSAGRAKIIKYQLNSNNRKELCCLQGIEYSAGSNFADIEPALLPRILALIGEEHGQSEFYAALIPMVPDLMSCVDTTGMMKDLMVKNAARDNDLVVQIAELTRQRVALFTKNDQLSGRLAVRESGDSRQKTSMAVSGKKRQRS